MSLFLNCLIVVIVVFGVGFLAGMLVTTMSREERELREEELLPIEIGEVSDNAEQ